MPWQSDRGRGGRMPCERDGEVSGRVLEIRRAAAAAAALRFQGNKGVMEARTVHTGNFARHHEIGKDSPGLDDPALLLSALESFKKVTMGCRLYMGVQEMPTKLLNTPCRNDAVKCQLITASLVGMRDLEDLLPQTRAGLSIAADMCRKMPCNVSNLVMEAVPLLTNLLNYEDAKVLEHASVCLTRIAVGFASSKEKLDELSKSGLVAQAAALLSVSYSKGQVFPSTLTYTGIIRLLSICASGSPLAAKTLLLHGISGTLKNILSGSVMVSGTTVSPTLTRPADQMYEIVNLADQVLPPLPAGTISLPEHRHEYMKGFSIRPGSSKQGESGPVDIEVSGQKNLLRDQPELLQQFAIDILPTMTQVYGSSVNGQIRHKCLSVIAKLMHYSSADMIEFFLSTTNISSFLAGILSLKDPQVLISGLQIAKILAEKLPTTFSKLFPRERALKAIESLICLEFSSPMLSQVLPQKRSIPLSTKSVRRPSTRSKSLATVDCAANKDTQEGSRNTSKGKDKAVKSPSDEPRGPCTRTTVCRKVASKKDEIFIKHDKLTSPVGVKLDQPPKDMIEAYKKRLKMKHLDFYFSYNSKVIDPNRTLSSYGIMKGCTIDINNRIRGGTDPRLSFTQYVDAHKAEFTSIEMLPDGNLSLKMTVDGCRFLSSLLDCFTWTWSGRKSWNGRYSWDTNFSITNGRVRIAKKQNATGGLQRDCMENDIKPLLDELDVIFSNNDFRLKDNRPPYLSHLRDYLGRMKSSVLIDDDKLILASHVAAMECHERLMLGISLRRRYKGSSKKEKKIWHKAIQKARAGLGWDASILELPVFEDISSEADKRNESYVDNNDVYFRLTRDYGVHSVEYRWKDHPDKTLANDQTQKFADDDSVELMIPMHLNVFLARLIEELILAKIDIRRELASAVVRCSGCTIKELANPVVRVDIDEKYQPTWMRKLSAVELAKLKQMRTHSYTAASPQITGTSKVGASQCFQQGEEPTGRAA